MTRHITSIKKIGASDLQNTLIKIAYQACGLDCVLTWQAESGWVVDRISNRANYDGTRDFGICQMNSRYHAEFIHSAAFRDPFQQLQACIDIWNSHKNHLKTTFYGYNVRNTRGVTTQFDIKYQ